LVIGFQDTVENVGDVFLRHSVDSKQNNGSQFRLAVSLLTGTYSLSFYL